MISYVMAKRVEPQAGMSALKGEIDQLAQRGQLYGLSKNEIDIAENK